MNKGIKKPLMEQSMGFVIGTLGVVISVAMLTGQVVMA